MALRCYCTASVPIFLCYEDKIGYVPLTIFVEKHIQNPILNRTEKVPYPYAGQGWEREHDQAR